MFRTLTALGLVTLCLVGASAPAHADDFYVSPGDSIQAAIDRAGPGDSIHITPATYFENLLIPQRKDGLSIFARGVVLDAYPAPEPGVGELRATKGAGLVIESNDVSVNGLCIVNARDGIHRVIGKSDGDGVRVLANGVTLNSLMICHVEGFGATVIGDGAQLLDMTVVDAARGGLSVVGHNAVVRKNHVDGQGYTDELIAGLKLGPGTRLLAEGNKIVAFDVGIEAQDALDLVIRANEFEALAIGIMLMNSPSTEVHDNLFESVETGVQLFASPSALIDSNRFFSYEYGIRTMNRGMTWEADVACQSPAMVVSKNRFRGGREGTDPQFPAAAVSTSAWFCPVIATGNLVHDSAGFGFDLRVDLSQAIENRFTSVHGIALMLTGDGLRAEANRISGAGLGILVSALGNDIDVSENQIDSIRLDGIAVFGELLGGRFIMEDGFVNQVLGRGPPLDSLSGTPGNMQPVTPIGDLVHGGHVILSRNTLHQVIGKGLMITCAAELTGNSVDGAMGEALALDVLPASVRLVNNSILCSRTPVTDALFGAGLIDGGGNTFDVPIDLTHLPGPMPFTY